MKNQAFFDLWDSFLNNYHLYYRDLSDKGKKRFVNRVHSIYLNVDILGKEDLEITDEIRVLVISNLVQLTFGLKEFWLYGYDYINLYPEAFMVKSSGEAVAGSTYQTKMISLSWQDFAKDHLQAHSGKNISLAQYAQALVRTVMNGKKYDLHFGSYLDTWLEIIRKECLAKSDGTAAMRLSENQDDIQFVFSKSVEMFFEKPDLFKKELPTSYAHLCLLLNQDPMNITEDYAYERERLSKSNVLVHLPPHVPITFKYKNWHWIYNLSFFGLTACPMALYLISDRHLVQTAQILILILLTGLVISVVFYKAIEQLGLFRKWWMFALNSVLGISPCLVTTLLLVNQAYAYPSTAKVSSHAIASYYQTEHYTNHTSTQIVTFNFSDEFLIDYPKARTFDEFEKKPTNKSTLFNGITYDIRNGLIGIPLIYQRELY